LVDVVGCYLNPPDKAVVLCMDEKSQVQALDRTQPGLPMKPGRAGTMTHDYKRHATTTLFAALNVVTGTVIGKCFDRHRHERLRPARQRHAHLRCVDAQESHTHVAHGLHGHGVTVVNLLADAAHPLPMPAQLSMTDHQADASCSIALPMAASTR
jgi:hypothetical protein